MALSRQLGPGDVGFVSSTPLKQRYHLFWMLYTTQTSECSSFTTISLFYFERGTFLFPVLSDDVTRHCFMRSPDAGGCPDGMKERDATYR